MPHLVKPRPFKARTRKTLSPELCYDRQKGLKELGSHRQPQKFWHGLLDLAARDDA